MKTQFLEDAYRKTGQSVLKELQSSSVGLSTKEAASRLEQNGQNTLPSESAVRIKWKIFWQQWKSPLLYLLVFAAVISFLLGEHLDAYVVFGTAFVNALVGFLQENKANKALAELAEYAPQYVEVLRDRKIHQIESRFVVVGDIIVLREGSEIPADARLLTVQDVFTDEASLTGESSTVEKHIKKLSKKTTLADRKNMVYAGTALVRGKATAVVVATDVHTELGRIATMVRDTKDTRTPLQEQVHKLGQMITVLVAIASVGIFVVGVLQGRELVDVFLISVAVGVAAIPEGLIISLTVILTVGMRRILARQALTRKLVAAEGLGSVSVMCVDKTGTITAGFMRVTQHTLSSVIFNETSTQQTEELLFMSAALCTEAEIVRGATLEETSFRGEPTEGALLQAAVERGLYKDELESVQPRLATIAFDHGRMYMATLHKQKSKHVVYCKGALEAVLQMCTNRVSGKHTKRLTKKSKEQILQWEREMTSQGLRVLAVAFAKVPKSQKTLSTDDMPNLTFVGLIGMQDPVRAGVADVITKAQAAGVRTVMITGDHVLTATHIARSVGLFVDKRSMMTGAELDNISDARLQKVVEKVSVFARVEPRHKIRIVQALQANGEVVAMTGDGVNDAPAIKAADIGIAVGSGTDVARNVADLVLLDNNVSTIVAAIEQGRIIFANIRKVVLYLLCNMFTEVILVVGALLVFLPLPITAVQILWINFVTDAFPNMALAFDPGDRGVMQKPPRRRGTPIVDKEMKIVIFIVSIVADFLLFLFFISIYASNLGLAFVQTLIFLTVGMGSILYIYAVRSLEKPVWKTNPFSNPYLILAQVFGIAMLVVAVHVPQLRELLGTVEIGGVDWLVVVLVAALKLILIEIIKGAFRLARRYGKTVQYASS